MFKILTRKEWRSLMSRLDAMEKQTASMQEELSATRRQQGAVIKELKKGNNDMMRRIIEAERNLRALFKKQQRLWQYTGK